MTCFCHESTGSIRKNEAQRARIGIYNLFNFANYDAPGNTLGGTLDGQPGSTNGTNAAPANEPHPVWFRRLCLW